jgi:hypothetical protein
MQGPFHGGKGVRRAGPVLSPPQADDVTTAVVFKVSKSHAFEGWWGLATAAAFADVFVVLLRQHIVGMMRPIAFAAAQLNVALHDGAVSPIPAISSLDLDGALRASPSAGDAQKSGDAGVDHGDDVVGREVAA